MKQVQAIALGIALSAFLAVAALGIEPSQVFRNVVVHPDTALGLAELNGWIYKKNKQEEGWKKLIPGRCPQWYPDGKHFFYFLPTGYDWSHELWSANVDGEGRTKLSPFEFIIDESPAVSADGHSLAFHHRTCMASGDYDDIVVTELFGAQPSEAKVVLRTRDKVDVQSLRWAGVHELEVRINDSIVRVRTSGPGEPQLP